MKLGRSKTRRKRKGPSDLTVAALCHSLKWEISQAWGSKGYWEVWQLCQLYQRVRSRFSNKLSSVWLAETLSPTRSIIPGALQVPLAMIDYGGEVNPNSSWLIVSCLEPGGFDATPQVQKHHLGAMCAMLTVFWMVVVRYFPVANRFNRD